MPNQWNMLDIVLEQKTRVEAIRKACEHELSAHAFVSLFLWKKQMGLSIGFGKNSFFVKSECDGDNAWFFPCGDEAENLDFLNMHVEEDNLKLVYLRKQDVDFLEVHFPGQFRVYERPESSEYVFERTQQEKLAGGSFSNIRNQMNHLQRSHEVMCRNLMKENLEDAVGVITRAKGTRHVPGYHALIDDGIAKLALDHREELGMKGVLVYVDGVPEALTLGFPLTHDTIDGCIERHNSAIPGLSCYTQRALLLEAPEQYRYMNGEEDLGLDGLRKMKRHMCPIRMNTIYEAERHVR